MKQTLINCGKLEVRQSPVEGYGVFATGDIKKGEILEEVPFVLFPEYTKLGESLVGFLRGESLLHDDWEYHQNLRGNLKFKLPEKYYFKWSPPSPLLKEKKIEYTVLPLGNACIYNTSNTHNNAGWMIEDQLFVFVAEKDIQKGEEIKTFYGYFIGEDSETYNVESVFFHGLERGKDGLVRLFELRRAAEEHVQLLNTNVDYQKLITAINEADDGLRILGIQSLEANRTVKYNFQFPPNWSIAFFYKKLNEFKRCKLPFTQLTYSYEKDGQVKNLQITIPNR